VSLRFTQRSRILRSCSGGAQSTGILQVPKLQGCRAPLRYRAIAEKVQLSYCTCQASLMAWGIAQWFIYGEVDWNRLNSQLRAVAPFIAGALFGAGWWCWCAP